MRVIELCVAVELIACQAPSFAVPCRGHILKAVYTPVTGKPTNSWALFEPINEDGSAGARCIIRKYKVQPSLPVQPAEKMHDEV